MNEKPIELARLNDRVPFDTDQRLGRILANAFIRVSSSPTTFERSDITIVDFRLLPFRIFIRVSFEIYIVDF